MEEQACTRLGCVNAPVYECKTDEVGFCADHDGEAGVVCPKCDQAMTPVAE